MEILSSNINGLRIHEASRVKAKNEFGQLDSVYALYTKNLGFFYESIANYEKALPLLIEALDVREKILEAWERKEELSKNCRQWYLDNCRFIDWEEKMKKLIS